MKLSDRERKMLRIIQMNPVLSAAAISAALKCKPHVVRYIIDKLRLTGILQRTAFVDPARIGLVPHTLYVSSPSFTPAERTEFVRHMCQLENVHYIGEYGGGPQWHISLMTRHPSELKSFLDLLTERYGRHLGERDCCSILSSSLYGTKALYPSISTPVIASSAFVPGKSVELDPTDRKILAAMANESFESQADLQGRLGVAISESTLRARINALEKSGVISGYYYRLPPDQLGMIPFDFLLRFRGLTSKIRQQFFDFCKAHPSIDVMFELSGSWDFLLGAPVNHYEDALSLLETLNEQFSGTLVRAEVSLLRKLHKSLQYPFKS